MEGAVLNGRSVGDGDLSFGRRIRTATQDDVVAIHRLLEELPRLYPGADHWLSRTIESWRQERAKITVAEAQDQVVGLTIVKRKTASRDKLCTLFVASDWRRAGLGTALLAEVVNDWRSRRVQRAIVTCRLELSTDFAPLFGRSNFQIVGRAVDRYGPGTREVIYEWRGDAPKTDSATVAPTRLRTADLLGRQGV